MDKIREISPNNYALVYNGKSLSSFYKIEKIAMGSHYYCLWPNSEYFYLFHIEKEKYALYCNSISAANKFTKIEYYSAETGSFVAYRKDENFAHIIFEDGHIESTTFYFVGEETEGTRPVKTCSDRWYFYDTRKRKYNHLTGSKGYMLDGSLEKILTYNIFIVNKNKRGKRLILYNQGKAPIYSRDYFDSIEMVSKSMFIGKLYNRNIYCIIKANNIAYPIGYYTSFPKFIKEHNLFIALKGESYCIVKGEKEVQNHQWKSDLFIFQNSYVFNKQMNSSCWKIFNVNDGHEIPTDLKNIQVLDSQGLFLSAETNGILNKKISIENIEQISQNYIHNLLEERIIKEKATKIEDKVIIQDEIISNNIDNHPVIKEDSKICNKEETKLMKNNVDSNNTKLLPPIKYYIFVPLASIIDNRITSGRINCETFRGATYIAWFIHDKHKLIVTESRRTKVHNILYAKEHSPLVEKLYKGKPFWVYRQLYPINCSLNYLNVDTIEQELSLLLNQTQLLGIRSERKELSTNSIKKQEQLQGLKTGNTSLLEQSTTKYDLGYTRFSFDHTSYQLKIDEVWDIDDIFHRKRVQYRMAGNIIAILYDFTTDNAVKLPNGYVHYHIYGEGKDKRFDQYFGQNSNTLLRESINDKTKRILLFKRNAKKELLFQDEVKCIGHYTISEKDNNRTAIIFKFESILRYRVNNTTNLDEPEKEQVKIETKETFNKKEVEKPSNQTNMSKLQELYETREKLLSLGIAPNADLEKQLSALEEESIQNEVVPIITQTIEPVLKSVRRKIVLIVDYDPEDGVQVHLSQKKSVHEITTIKKSTNLMEKNIDNINAYKKLRVTFPDGTIICERAVVDTLAFTIQKFGAEKVAQLCEYPIDSCLKPSGVNLVTKKISPKYENVQRKIKDGWLIFSCTNTITKKRQIEVIANALNINIKVDLI